MAASGEAGKTLVSAEIPVKECGLTNRWSGRVKDKVPSSIRGARGAQLNR
jgi:hypothetical protein